MPHVTNMVMSISEGHLPSEQAIPFLQTYQQQLAERPPRVVAAYVVHSMEDATLWRTIALWPSREAFDEYRASVDVTGGVLLFHTVCVEPTVAIFEVLGEWTGTRR